MGASQPLWTEILLDKVSQFTAPFPNESDHIDIDSWRALSTTAGGESTETTADGRSLN